MQPLIPTEAFPLQWPSYVPRTKHPKRNYRFKNATINTATNKLMRELRQMGARNVILSSNLHLKSNGLPYSDQRLLNQDCGVAVYFVKDGQTYVIGCDQFDRPEHNLTGLYKTVEAMRGIERWGCTSLLNRMFTGFRALPQEASPSTDKLWFEVLGVDSDAYAATVKQAHLTLAKKYHPDNPETGDAEKFKQVQQAWETFQKIGK